MLCQGDDAKPRRWPLWVKKSRTGDAFSKILSQCDSAVNLYQTLLKILQNLRRVNDYSKMEFCHLF